MEDLRVALGGWLVINQKLTSDHDNDITVTRRTRLGVESGNLMLDFLESQRSQLFNNVLSTLDLIALESEHGVVAVQRRKKTAVSAELAVVVVHKLLS